MLPASVLRPSLGLLLSLGLVMFASPAALAQPSGQTGTPPSGTLKLAPKHPEPAHAPPKAAPVAPVHQAPAHQAPAHQTSAHQAGAHPPAASKKTPVVSPKSAPAKHPPHGKPAAPAAPVVVPAPAQQEQKPAAPAEPQKGSSGLPLPRYAALRSDEVNLRKGPGTRYPIEWVYKRRDLPVEIEREFESWRLVKDPDGVKGWVHQATLTGRRSFVVTGAERTLRRDPDDKAAPVAMLKPGVVGRIRTCQPGAAWCQMQVGEYRGWLKRDEFWGTYGGEAVNP